MRLPQLAGCVIIGILPLLWLPVLPGRWVIWGLMTLALLIAQCRRRPAQYAALITLFFVWGALSAGEVLWPTERLTDGNRQVDVELTATDGQTTHQGKIIRLDGRRLFPAPGISLYGSYLPETPCAGQVWAMTLRARPVHGQLNDGGFDSQRHALSQHRPLTGRFITADVRVRTCSLRARYLASLNQTLNALPWQSVMLGLGMGERLAIPREIKTLMQETGTSHLMAISGLHIALGASLGWLLLRGVQFFLPCRWLGWPGAAARWSRKRDFLRRADRHAATRIAHLRRAVRWLRAAAIRKTLVAMAAMGLLHWRNTVCRSAGGVVRKPLALRICRCGAYLLVSAGADAGRQKERATASKPRVMPSADRFNVFTCSSTDRTFSRHQPDVRAGQLDCRAAGDLCRCPANSDRDVFTPLRAVYH